MVILGIDVEREETAGQSVIMYMKSGDTLEYFTSSALLFTHYKADEDGDDSDS